MSIYDAEEQAVKQYMRLEIEYHVDARTGEVNCTTLAEDAINEFALEDGDGAPVWDWAVEVAEEHEDQEAGSPLPVGYWD